MVAAITLAGLVLAFFLYRYSLYHQRRYRKIKHLHALLVLMLLSMLLLSEALSWISCKVVGEADWTDHVVFCGAVEAGARRDDTAPSIHVRRTGLSY